MAGPACTITVICAGSSMPTSLYVEYGRHFALSPFAVTGLFAVYVAVLIPTVLWGGGLSDRWGRRRVAYAGIALAALGSAVLASAQAPCALFAGRMLQGAAAGLTSGAATAALADAAHEGGGARPRGSVVSLASLAISVGSASGPLLSGTLAAVAPAPLAAPYLVHLLLLLLVLLLRWPQAAPRAPGPWRPRRPGVPRAVRRTFATAAVTTVFAWSLLGVFLALVPAVAAALNPGAGTVVGGATVALMLLCSALAQPCAGRLVPGAGQAAGLGVLAAGLVLLVLACWTRSLPLLAVAAVASGAGQGLGFTGALTGLTAALPARQRGAVLSVTYAVGYLALAVPVLAVGAVADRTGMVVAVAGFGVSAVPACLAALVWVRRSGAVRPDPELDPEPDPEPPHGVRRPGAEDVSVTRR
ncbi:hypothetical protein A6A06_26250 [Streptomyces sp. CB02923]|uniref:MFS transporter n=1 Tax=Streptomyces sp. CB02923 TaxID=1718985 RepID=UPI00093B8167|nr:MFS transporter [Streptomyces sp. CB02923]OKH99089.1 hypothetical protein A6A06_26250 [Streptomyces sp. CB02923]